MTQDLIKGLNTHLETQQNTVDSWHAAPSHAPDPTVYTLTAGLLVDDQVVPRNRKINLGEDEWDDTTRLRAIHRSYTSLPYLVHIDRYVLYAKIMVLEDKVDMEPGCRPLRRSGVSGKVAIVLAADARGPMVSLFSSHPILSP